MPAIPVSSNDWNELAFNAARLWIDPVSFKSTAGLEDECKGHWIHGVFSLLGSANLTLTDDQMELMYSAHPDGSPTVNANETNIRDAFVAGQILIKTLRLARHQPEKASVANAIKIVSWGFRKGPHPLGRAAMLKAWGRYKRVSHITGAHFAAAKEMGSLVKLINIFRDLPDDHSPPPKRKYTDKEKRAVADLTDLILQPFLDAANNFYPRLFSYAEKLRQAGEQHFAPGQKVRGLPLLDPDAMWTVPSTFALPDVEPDFGPPLTELELSITKSRK